MWTRKKYARTTVVDENDRVVASCSWSDTTKNGIELLKEQLATCRLIENAPRMKKLLERIEFKRGSKLSLDVARVLASIEYNEEDEKFLREMS